MSLCPYCQTQIDTQAEECPSCKLTFPRTSALVGAVPRIDPIVADMTGQLKAGETARISRKIARVRRRFPQVVIQVVMNSFTEKHPIAMHAFWLFNVGAFAGTTVRGDENHAVMILVDPNRQEAAIVPGYGLEPFLQEAALTQLLETAGPAFLSRKWEQGIGVILNGLDRLFELVTETGDDKSVEENDF